MPLESGEILNMRFSVLKKWILLLAASGFILQATTGCPNDAAIRGVLSTSTQSLITGLLGLYIKAGTNSAFGV
jgi:hypothetical protein